MQIRSPPSLMSSSSSSSEDRISDLPDPVLCHVLSFLPTQLAVQTSILAKRWKKLWLSIMTLNLSETDFPAFSTFTNILYNVLIKRDSFLPIKSLSLTFDKYPLVTQDEDFHPQIAKQQLTYILWIASDKGIQNLSLHTTNNNSDNRAPISIPPDCDTLVAINLSNLLLDYNSPSFKPLVIHYPSLKTLYLDSVTFSCFQDFVQLLVGATNLEDLQIRCVKQANHQIFRWGPILEGNYSNLLTKLVRAHISYAYIPFELLCRAQFLRVQLFDSRYLGLGSPEFDNLTNLDLTFNSISFWNEKWKWIIQVLQNSPKLQYLAIRDYEFKGFVYDRSWGGDWEEPQTVPECLSSNFRELFLGNYIGLKSELHFAKYIMENSKVLQTIRIDSTWGLHTQRDEMLIGLSECSWASTTCNFIFS